MSRTAAGAALTITHRRQQLALQAQTIRDLLALWPAWNPRDQASWDRFVVLATTLVRLRNGQSAGLAAGYFDRFRVAEGIGAGGRVLLAEPPPEAQIVRSLTQTGLVGTLRALSVGQTPEAALRNGFTRLAGAAGRHVLDGGRVTLIRSAGTDRTSGGWARVTSGSPCYFCAMLASRGPVFSSDAADFEAHDHCSCTAEPVYAGSRWPGKGREFRDMWNRETRGLSGQEARNAFRRALAG